MEVRRKSCRRIRIQYSYPKYENGFQFSMVFLFFFLVVKVTPARSSSIPFHPRILVQLHHKCFHTNHLSKIILDQDMFFQEFECQTLKHSPDLLLFFDHHCVHPLKKTPLHKQEFLLVFLTGRVDPHRIWIHRCLRPLFLGGLVKLCLKSHPKKKPSEKRPGWSDNRADGEAILTQMACLAFWSLAKIASWLS